MNIFCRNNFRFSIFEHNKYKVWSKTLQQQLTTLIRFFSISSYAVLHDAVDHIVDAVDHIVDAVDL